MRIHDTETRERLYSDLMDATGEGTKSGALDAAARHYCRMAGRNGVRAGDGALEELLSLALDQGSVTPEQIADVLGTLEYPIDVERRVEIGPE